MLSTVDSSIGYIVDQLEKNNLTNKVNMIVVSDHGRLKINNYILY